MDKRVGLWPVEGDKLSSFTSTYGFGEVNGGFCVGSGELARACSNGGINGQWGKWMISCKTKMDNNGGMPRK